MTEAAFQRRVQWWVKRLEPLGLTTWDIDVEFTDDLDTKHSMPVRAQVWINPMYEDANLEVCKAQLSAPDTDYVIVHELLHIVFRDYDRAALAPLESLGAEAQKLYKERLDHEQEGVIERLTRVLVNALKP